MGFREILLLVGYSLFTVRILLGRSFSLGEVDTSETQILAKRLINLIRRRTILFIIEGVLAYITAVVVIGMGPILFIAEVFEAYFSLVSLPLLLKNIGLMIVSVYLGYVRWSYSSDWPYPILAKILALLFTICLYVELL